MEKVIISKETVLALKEGSDKAFEEVFLAFFGKVKSFIAGIIRQDAEAEELAQDVFMRIWMKRETIDAGKPFGSFLFTLAYNAAINSLKHKTVEDAYLACYTFPENTNQTEEHLFAKEISLLVEMAVDRMPEQRGRIFRLSRRDGLSNDEIASRLEISRKTVENQISLALKELRRIITACFILFL